MNNINPRDIYTEEHELFRETVAAFIAKEVAPYHAQWEKDKMVPREVWKKAGELGLLCLQTPEAYGGIEIPDFRYNAIISEEFGRSGFTGPGLGFSVHSDIVVPYLIHYGTEAVKEAYLPGVTDGSKIAAICMTEPGAGSDLQGMRSSAVDKGDHYLLNGSKTFISNGYQSDVCVVAAKTDPSLGAKGISLFAVDCSWEGVSKGIPFEKVGMHAQDTCEVFFDNVKVPKDHLLGEEGKGFIYMMTELPQERISVAILGLAAAEGALNETLRYVKERKAFGKDLAQFQNTRFKIAELATECEIGRIYVDRLVVLHSEKRLEAAAASQAKYAMTDLQCRVIDECVQLHGGYGYMWEFYVARAYADARAQRIYAGTNEIMKELVARRVIK